MKKMLNLFGRGIILLLLEFFSFNLFKTIDLESLFALWTIILLILLIGNISGLNASKRQGVSQNFYSVTDESIKKSEEDKITNRILNNTNYVYMTFILLNIIGFFISQ